MTHKRKRNRLARVRRIAKRCGCSADLATQIEIAQRSIAALPEWLRNQMYFAGSDAATGHHCEENP